uniref:Macaca fascicularis brain cDNA clone: QflA-21727, similar to human vasoactive intestinal peptide receptor 2 (VIPR2), mRNA, RefSeq: NM_003382.3 n=1 Tax=Macaca fascicularis TaxID=9541 RepID=I7GNN9_MACFA|nr:unnamed protein product [Macaca fascicularis]
MHYATWHVFSHLFILYLIFLFNHVYMLLYIGPAFFFFNLIFVYFIFFMAAMTELFWYYLTGAYRKGNIFIV